MYTINGYLVLSVNDYDFIFLHFREEQPSTEGKIHQQLIVYIYLID